MKLYRRLNQKAIFDNFRKVFVEDTPEERIRQQIAEQLVSKADVPRKFIYTEYPLARFDKSTRKRADILVCYRQNEEVLCLLVIEVKSDKVPLNDRVISQVKEYRDIIGCDFIGIVNGKNLEDLIIYKVQENNELSRLDGMPKYDQLLNKIGLKFLPPPPLPKRFSYDKVSSKRYLQKLYYDRCIIGQDTPRNLWPFIAELHNFFEAEKVNTKLPYIFGDITINEDIGSNLLNFGNPSGAVFSTLYRGFIIKDADGNDEICRIAVNSVAHTENDPKYGNRKGTTVLNVAVDNFDKASDHILELCLDKWLKPCNNYFKLIHDGRMSGIKSEVVLSYISNNAPELIKDNKIYLGKLQVGVSISWENAIDVVSRILLYASLRRRLRKLKKSSKNI